MLCAVCRKSNKTRPHSQFGVRYFPICPACAEALEANKARPYSRVMDAAALAEAGYFINRKRARW